MLMRRRFFFCFCALPRCFSERINEALGSTGECPIVSHFGRDRNVFIGLSGDQLTPCYELIVVPSRDFDLLLAC